MSESSRHESSLALYFRVLRRRKWIVLVCALLVPVAAYIFSVRQAKMYEASAEVYIDKQNLASALTGIQDTTLYVDEDRAAATQVGLARLPIVARRAIELAKVGGLRPQELLDESSVDSRGNSDILGFTVRDGDPEQARRLATGYAEAFVEYRTELDTRAIARAHQELTQKLSVLDEQGRQDTPLYASLSDTEQRLATLQTLQTSRASVVRTADEASQVAPQPLRNAALGLVLGVILGVGLAFAADALDTRIRSATEIGERLGLPLLARIPPPPKELARSAELVMVAQPRSAGAEIFRVLRANLDFARLAAGDVRSVLVTSAVEEEGKSTTAANLALALARSGRRVALVDLDLRRPFLDRCFGLVHARGLTDVALGTSTLDAALRPIDLAEGKPLAARSDASLHGGTLDVLVSGVLPPDPGEFVGTPKVREILGELRERYELVLIDGPPLLRVVDAMMLSSRVDGLLVVSRLNLLRRPMLGEMRRQLDVSPAPGLGYVVTDVSAEPGYGGGYGYSYDSAYDEAYASRARERPAGVDEPRNGRTDPLRTEETV